MHVALGLTGILEQGRCSRRAGLEDAMLCPSDVERNEQRACGRIG